MKIKTLIFIAIIGWAYVGLMLLERSELKKTISWYDERLTYTDKLLGECQKDLGECKLLWMPTIKRSK